MTLRETLRVGSCSGFGFQLLAETGNPDMTPAKPFATSMTFLIRAIQDFRQIQMSDTTDADEK